MIKKQKTSPKTFIFSFQNLSKKSKISLIFEFFSKFSHICIYKKSNLRN